MDNLRRGIDELLKTHTPYSIHQAVFDVLNTTKETGHVLICEKLYGCYRLPQKVVAYITSNKNRNFHYMARAIQYEQNKYINRSTLERELDYMFVTDYCKEFNLDVKNFLETYKLSVYPYQKGVKHNIEEHCDYLFEFIEYGNEFCNKDTCDGTCFK